MEKEKLGIMQPYFFPYLGYFSLIKHTDYWVVFDTPQFIRHGWIERNRILKPNEGWQYVRAPLRKASRETPIKDMEIVNDQDWQRRILAQLEHYKKVAPYYVEVLDLVNETVSYETDSLVALDVKGLEVVCDYLDLDFPYEIFSESEFEIGEVSAPDEWALEISKALGAKEYYNPPGGQEFFDTSKYDNAGIKISFLSLELEEYDQKRKGFEPGLSIIDVMMFNSPGEINKMLDNYELL
jgi:hypothetical protein